MRGSVRSLIKIRLKTHGYVSSGSIRLPEEELHNDRYPGGAR
ncbi:hypothetical protein [Paenibacillus sp. HWE-109]|nr:hypothetical protein [Paenibacillus sp. HWE-109]